MYECAHIEVIIRSVGVIGGTVVPYSMVIGGVIVANIKSAKKRILVIDKKTERNKAIKSEVKTYVKKVYAAIEAGDKAAAASALTDATSKISKAANKGIFHKNTASRKISRLTKAVNEM